VTVHALSDMASSRPAAEVHAERRGEYLVAQTEAERREEQLRRLVTRYPSLSGEIVQLLLLSVPAAFGPPGQVPDTPEAAAARQQLREIEGKHNRFG
jgi:hypothetical protein